MKRRDFIVLVGSVMAGWPLAARAQQPERLARIGYLAIAPAAQAQGDDTAFREGLRDLGYVEGRNLHIEYRTAAGDESRVPVLAKELAGLHVDVIVTQANGVVAAVHATSKIPIVWRLAPTSWASVSPPVSHIRVATLQVRPSSFPKSWLNGLNF